ncbi:MAG: hypothetical protein U9R24_07420 [Thermodesulfobacteriota bacterium]|nr:hypothetical protein [Thermodesulfobacteriota bacterium]
MVEEFESRLVPILRQGVAVVQMVFFKRLKEYLSEKNPGKEAAFITMLTGAVVNDIFGTPNEEKSSLLFVEENEALIEETLKEVPLQLVDMMVPLTDALRVRVLCDHQEGIDNFSVLARANELKILLVPREIPMPSNFITLVRELGNRHDILMPPEIRRLDS